MSAVDDDEDNDDSYSDDVAPSQDENEDEGDGGGDDAFSQHSPTSPDTQSILGSYPNLELLAVSHAGEEDGDWDVADGGHPSGLGSRRSPYPPDYDVELYGSVSSESEDEMEDPGQLGSSTTKYAAIETNETQGPHLLFTPNERKKEKEVVKCPNWPHLPFVSLSPPIPFLFLLLNPSHLSPY